jgi:hypothetical protein
MQRLRAHNLWEYWAIVDVLIDETIVPYHLSKGLWVLLVYIG